MRNILITLWCRPLLCHTFPERSWNIISVTLQDNCAGTFCKHYCWTLTAAFIIFFINIIAFIILFKWKWEALQKTFIQKMSVWICSRRQRFSQGVQLLSHDCTFRGKGNRIHHGFIVQRFQPLSVHALSLCSSCVWLFVSCCKDWFTAV